MFTFKNCPQRPFIDKLVLDKNVRGLSPTRNYFTLTDLQNKNRLLILRENKC